MHTQVGHNRTTRRGSCGLMDRGGGKRWRLFPSSHRSTVKCADFAFRKVSGGGRELFRDVLSQLRHLVRESYKIKLGVQASHEILRKPLKNDQGT